MRARGACVQESAERELQSQVAIAEELRAQMVAAEPVACGTQVSAPQRAQMLPL
jgi:hypothetical protein